MASSGTFGDQGWKPTFYKIHAECKNIQKEKISWSVIYKTVICKLYFPFQSIFLYEVANNLSEFDALLSVGL